MSFVPVLDNPFVKTLLEKSGIDPTLVGDCELEMPITGALGLRIHILITKEALEAACKAMEKP